MKIIFLNNNYMKSYNNNKTFFNYIIENKYEIIKDTNSNDTLKIIYGTNSETKCKYILLFTIENLPNNLNKLVWSCNNPYIDQKTQSISLFVKKAIEEHQSKLNKDDYNWDNFSQKELLLIINTIIKDNLKINYNGSFIEPIWILEGKVKNFTQYYMITDIVYY